MEQLKNLAKQSENLMRATQRQLDLIERTGASDPQLGQMIEEFVEQIDTTFDALKNSVRIAPEQLNADQTFRNALETSLKGWRLELDLNQRDQVDQAIVDSNDKGERSERYLDLEKRETELKALIIEAEQKLGKVSERVGYPLATTITEIIDKAKPIIPIILMLILTSCTAEQLEISSCANSSPVGFWHGLWHGMIAPLTFVISIFSDDVTMYAVNNVGAWYDFGFVIGAGILSLSTRRK